MMLRWMVLAAFALFSTSIMADDNIVYQLKWDDVTYKYGSQQLLDAESQKPLGWRIPVLLKNGERVYYNSKIDEKDGAWIMELSEGGTYTIIHTDLSGKKVEETVSFEKGRVIDVAVPFNFEMVEPEQSLAALFEEGDTLTIHKTDIMVSCGIAYITTETQYIKEKGVLKSRSREYWDFGMSDLETNEPAPFAKVPSSDLKMWIQVELDAKMPENQEKLAKRAKSDERRGGFDYLVTTPTSYVYMLNGKMVTFKMAREHPYND